MDGSEGPERTPSSLRAVTGQRYVLGSVLGRGGSGTVYRATELVSDRPVAIKLLDTSDQQSLERFHQELSLAAKLTHPNIARVISFGTTDDGKPFYVTPWLDGRDLRYVLDRGHLTRREALEVAIAVAEGLEYIHSKQIIHRDLKPSNVFIPGHPPVMEYRQAKILDFGVAGLLSSDGFTRVGMIFGTPVYMSPEQLMGKPQSPAADVYGWGLLLYEMLTGVALRSRADTTESLFESITHDPPDYAFEGVPKDCAILIRLCLSRDPDERPATGQIVEAAKRLAAPDEPGRSSRYAASTLTTPKRSANELVTFAPAASARLFLAKYKFSIAILLGLAAVVCFLLLYSQPQNRVQALTILCGVAWMMASVAGGFWLRGWLNRRSAAGATAFELASGAKSRVDLTATIALQLDDLIQNLRALDERILAGTVALMLDEFSHATDPKDRQSALMNVVALSEKLGQRLSPWYVRYKDVIASGVAVIGALSGLFTAINAMRTPHKP